MGLMWRVTIFPWLKYLIPSHVHKNEIFPNKCNNFQPEKHIWNINAMYLAKFAQRIWIWGFHYKPDTKQWSGAPLGQIKYYILPCQRRSTKLISAVQYSHGFCHILLWFGSGPFSLIPEGYITGIVFIVILWGSYLSYITIGVWNGLVPNRWQENHYLNLWWRDSPILTIKSRWHAIAITRLVWSTLNLKRIANVIFLK